MNRTHVKRYPFGRWTLTRELIDPIARSECDFCGSREGKFVYFVEYDSISDQEDEIKGAFCSVDCMRYYHDFWDK